MIEEGGAMSDHFSFLWGLPGIEMVAKNVLIVTTTIPTHPFRNIQIVIQEVLPCYSPGHRTSYCRQCLDRLQCQAGQSVIYQHQSWQLTGPAWVRCKIWCYPSYEINESRPDNNISSTSINPLFNKGSLPLKKVRNCRSFSRLFLNCLEWANSSRNAKKIFSIYLWPTLPTSHGRSVWNNVVSSG